MSAKLLERDDRGWRTPREGTKSRGIYDLARKGMKPRFIADQLGIDRRVVRVLLFHMKNPSVNKYYTPRGGLPPSADGATRGRTMPNILSEPGCMASGKLRWNDGILEQEFIFWSNDQIEDRTEWRAVPTVSEKSEESN